MNDNEIKELLESKSYRIINIIKSINHNFDTDGKKIDFSENMNKNEIREFFDLLKKVLQDNKRLCFVILNEFFFSYHSIIEDECFKFIIDSAKSITEDNPLVVLLINLCHKINKKDVPENYKEKLELYLNKIYDNDGNEIWNVSSHFLSSIFGDKRIFYYANETFVIMRGSILYSYKKSSFYCEILNYQDYNYVIGFGLDEIQKGLDEELLKIEKLLSYNLS